MEATGLLVALLVLCAVVAALTVNHGPVQAKLVDTVTKALAEQLDTRVSIDQIKINLLNQSAAVYGLEVDDQQNQQLLRIGRVWCSVHLHPLFKGIIAMKEAKMEDADIRLVNPKDSAQAANYQFLIDKFSKQGKQEEKKEKRAAIGFALDLRHVRLSRLHVTYNDNDLSIGKGTYSDWRDDRQIVFSSLRFKTDNHKPRKNEGRPNRGAFDTGHLDITADMAIALNHIGKDSIAATLCRCCVTDTLTGINITDLHFDVAANPRTASITDLVVQQTNTVLNIPQATIQLPSKRDSIPLSYRADSITGCVILQDIARAFAPKALGRFNIPLNLSTSLSGTAQGMHFGNIRVTSDDKKLAIAAKGDLKGLEKKEALDLHFDVARMTAKPGIKDKIVKLFSGKKFLMRQFYALGTIRYRGSFDILYRKEQFRGKVDTDMGDLRFQFELNEDSKYVTGEASTDSILLGKLFNLKNFGNIACTASFKMDYSKKRTAQIRKERGGKLPIGEVTAHVDDVVFKKLHIRNVDCEMTSNGAEAEGAVYLKSTLSGVMARFSFTDTEQMHKMKIRPGLTALQKKKKKP